MAKVKKLTKTACDFENYLYITFAIEYLVLSILHSFYFYVQKRYITSLSSF